MSYLSMNISYSSLVYYNRETNEMKKKILLEVNINRLRTPVSGRQGIGGL